MNNKIIGVIAVVGLLLGVYSVFFTGPNLPRILGVAGGLLAENYIPYIQYNGGYYSEKNFQLGANGSDNAEMIAGTCALIPFNGTHVASTTRAYDCAVTGVTSGDIVQMQISTTTVTAIAPGFYIIAAKASTTDGFISAVVFNGSGTTNNASVAGFGSTTNYWIVDTD